MITGIYRASQIQSALQVLRETLERRYSRDEVVESRLDDLDIELKLLIRELEKEK